MSTATDSEAAVRAAAVRQDFSEAGDHLAEAITLVKRLRDSPAFFGSDDPGLYLAHCHAKAEGALELLGRALRAHEVSAKRRPIE